jgi:hypothetical protein
MSKLIDNEEEYKEFLETERLFLILRDKGYLVEVPEPTEPEELMIAYYDDEGNLCHSGRIEKDSWPNVKSVWVNRHCYLPGKVATHAVWHVPTSFGTKVKYYKKADSFDDAIQTYFTMKMLAENH